jgi:hypothetical protein
MTPAPEDDPVISADRERKHGRLEVEVLVFRDAERQIELAVVEAAQR